MGQSLHEVVVIVGVGDVGLSKVGVCLAHSIIMNNDVEFMRTIKSGTLSCLPVSRAVLLTHLRNGLILVVPRTHLEVPHLHPFAVQAFAKLLHSCLAASEVELSTLQLLLQLRVLLEVVLQDVVKFLNFQAFEGIEDLL